MITLHLNAPWATVYNQRLRRTYRERFAQHDGRYFRISAAHLNDLWSVEEITADGAWLAWVTVCARNLPACRLAIALHAKGADEREIAREVLSAPGAPTGRAKRRHA